MRSPAPGYGILAKELPEGWRVETEQGRGDVLRSARMTVTVAPQGAPWKPTGTAADIAKFFNGSTPGVGLSITLPDGTPLLQMQGWQMSVPNHKDGNANIPLRPPSYGPAVLPGGGDLCCAG